MVHNAITNHVVTAGDFNIVPAGQRLFDCPTCKPGKGGKVYYNVAPGQLVAFTINPTTLQPITVDETNVASVTGDLYIGVGVDTDGDGAADNVRLLAGEKFEKCLIDEYKVSAPVAPQPQILAAYLDCTNPLETYTVQFKYSDNRTRSFGLVRADQNEITVSASADEAPCPGCSTTVDPEKIVCKLVDSLNNKFNYRIGDEPSYPDKKEVRLPKDYRAVRLHDNWDVFCINPITPSADCQGCEVTDSIVSATINGQVKTFTGNLNPSNNAQTYLAQLENIAQQIECGFEEEYGPHAGFAFVAGNGGQTGCAPYQLHVVSCDNSFVLTGGSGPITACEAINPYPAFASEATCVDCGDPAPADYVPTTGLAVIIPQPKHLDQPNGDFVTKPMAFYGRFGELNFIKDAGSGSPIVKATELMAPVFPENFGSWIEWLEYSQFPRGRGRAYREVNARQGWLGTPDSVSRARNAVSFANRNKSYCTYYLGHNMTRHPSLTKSPAFNRLNSYVHIPSDESNTIASFEALMTAILSVNPSCTVIDSQACSGVQGNITIE